MYRLDGQDIFSATDLVGFLACTHLTNLERAAVAKLVERPHTDNDELERIAKRGIQHEERFLASLRAEGLEIVSISTDEPGGDHRVGLIRAAEETIAAMKAGADVIYQATFFRGGWRAHADFLRRVPMPSALGEWSYEAWDTKLAHHTKGSAIIQLCLYSELVGEVQGVPPESMHVALGGGERRIESFRFADYAAYFRLVRDTFLDAVQPEAVFPPSTRDEPVAHCEVCRWDMVCKQARRGRDDLALVANINASQREQLRQRGVETRTALGALALPLALDPPLKRSSLGGYTRVREQARIQVEGERAGDTRYELIDPARDRDGELEPARGLLLLPAPSEGDLFFDIEGDPFALDDGVDYLFGVIEPRVRDAEGVPAFHSFWSIDATPDVTADAERAAFEALVDLIVERLKADPNLHVYHYAPYEPAAMGRLMGRYGTREEEVDGLLRGGVFVDLFRIVRQGIRASVESYSIKKLEPLYGFERAIGLRDAGSSIVAFETWLELGGDAGKGPDAAGILDRIEAYNRDDCLSTWHLRDWLEGRRAELEAHLGFDLNRPAPPESAIPPELTEKLQHTQDIVDRLVQGVPEDAHLRSEEQQARWLLAQLMNWHRREDKSMWWRYFTLTAMTDDEREEEREPLAHLTALGPVRTEKKSTVYAFSFPPQDHKITRGSRPHDPATRKASAEVVSVDDAKGIVELKRLSTEEPPEPSSLVPLDFVGSREQQRSLAAVGEWVAANGIDTPAGEFAAARALLLRRPPLGKGLPLAADGESSADAARRLVLGLTGTYLAIQGPPGSGKTTLGAEMIVDLVASGKRVGVTANSHQVIGNLLDKVASRAKERGVEARIGQNGGGAPPTCKAAKPLDNAKCVAALSAGEVDVVGGTAWLWSRPDIANLVDVLFVDEAGQMSLANTVAVAPAASGLVLLGDPQQLDQPVKGSHPPGAERSALAHVLDANATVPPDMGLFLDTTWRLHPEICDYTSEVFYAARLRAEPGREGQSVTATGPLGGAGLRFIPVPHVGNSSESAEEADVIARMVRELLAGGATWIDANGTVKPLTLADILILTPYNMQVQAIAEALPGAAVGTVDKFQGRQAPIAIYSMATSSADKAPRGMEFLYSLNRLNVATSRAQCVAAVVASPELLRPDCRTPRQMRLANAFARFLEVADA